MKVRTLFWGFPLCILLGSCKPESFKTTLAGYTIWFPITMRELQNHYPNGYKSSTNRFIDTSQTVRVEWWFNHWGEKGNDDPNSKPFGLGIFLKNKTNQFDSIRTTLEKQYRQPLLPLKVTRLDGEFYTLEPKVYICHPNKNTVLALTKASSVRGDPWYQYNSVRISIGYNLDRTQEERFAAKDGFIHKDTD